MSGSVLATTAKRLQCVLAAWVIWIAQSGSGWADPWPTYRHDNRRSGVTVETIETPLQERWVWQSQHLPQPAWSGPAKWDAWSGNRGLQSMRNFDPCFYVTVDDQHVYFGSSVDDAVHALRVADGTERWAYITGAAVRLPPTISDGKVYFGSDDGAVYCCDAQTGELIWTRKASDRTKRIISNRKIISLWPVRTGVLVHDHRATFAGSLAPWEPSYFFTVDAGDGSMAAEGCYMRTLDDVTLQGALLASEQRIYVPQGRAAPLAIDRDSGKLRGTIGSAGGVYCILSAEDQLVAGPPDQKSDEDQMRIADASSDQSLVSFAGANRILLDGRDAYLMAEGKLRKLDYRCYVDAQSEIAEATALIKAEPSQGPAARATILKAEAAIQQAWSWAMASEPPLEIIKAGDSLVLGFDGGVRVVRASDGEEVWRTSVIGAAYGLAVASGRLYVSTDRGHIYAFGAARQ